MKITLLLTALFLLTISAENCHKHKYESTVYKGRLEVKGICMNYTIAVTEGKIDSSLVEQRWTDEVTKKTYSNVFGLGSPCNFPASINEGDEFYFTINTTVQNCAVCMAYYPTPAKRISIKVLDK